MARFEVFAQAVGPPASTSRRGGVCGAVFFGTKGSNERNEEQSAMNGGLSEQFPGKISVKGLAKHRLARGRGQMVFLVDPSLSENAVPDGVDSR